MLTYTIPINASSEQDIPGDLAFSPDDTKVAVYDVPGVLPACCPPPGYTYTGIFTLATGGFEALTVLSNNLSSERRRSG